MPSASWANGWLSGDVVTAAEFRKGVGSVYDTTLGIATATIDINPPIPTTYAHLLIVAYLRGDTAATQISLGCRFNNDAAANYYSQLSDAAAATPAASEALAQTSGAFGVMPANTAAANRFSTQVMWIPNYGGATNKKSFVGLSVSPVTTTTGTITLRQFGGAWDGTLAAITRITLITGAGNFVAGSRVTAYVMGA